MLNEEIFEKKNRLVQQKPIGPDNRLLLEKREGSLMQITHISMWIRDMRFRRWLRCHTRDRGMRVGIDRPKRRLPVMLVIGVPNGAIIGDAPLGVRN